MKVEPTDAGEAGDLSSRFDELMRIYTQPYAAAQYSELAEGAPLGRRERRERRDALSDSAPRLACYPRLLTEVRALASAGRREDVVRILTVGRILLATHRVPFDSRGESSKRVG